MPAGVGTIICGDAHRDDKVTIRALAAAPPLLEHAGERNTVGSANEVGARPLRAPEWSFTVR